jgi:hypothetical protein
VFDEIKKIKKIMKEYFLNKLSRLGYQRRRPSWWEWASMKPGRAVSPFASMTLLASPATFPMAATFSPLTPIEPTNAFLPDPSTMDASLTITSNSSTKPETPDHITVSKS